MSSLRQQLALRRLELLAQSAALRLQIAEDSAALRRRLNVGARVLALLPLLRSLVARFRR
jgi:hypothetical protein